MSHEKSDKTQAIHARLDDRLGAKLLEYVEKTEAENLIDSKSIPAIVAYLKLHAKDEKEAELNGQSPNADSAAKLKAVLTSKKFA